MERKLKAQIAGLSRADLAPLVRRVLDSAGAEVAHWTAEPVEGGFGHNLGITRFEGTVRSGDTVMPWSLILKAVGPEIGSAEPTAHDYWRREALVYQSGLLDGLPGPLVAPRCFGVVEQTAGEVWLWLEDVDEPADTWSPERHGLAAHHLGRFNGAYLAGKPIPDLPWLSTGPLAPRIAQATLGIPRLRELGDGPLFEGFVPPGGIDRMLDLWAHRDRLLAQLARLPRTLCHHDIHRRNLLARLDRHGQEETVVLDWSALGAGPVGSELAAMLLGLRFVAVDVDRVPDVAELIFDGYLRGLQDAGWQGDPALARFGYAATVALSGVADKAIKWPRVADYAAALPPDAEPPRLLSPGGPIQARALQSQLLELGTEVLALLDTLPARGGR